jgi:aryl-alcohol dehydrogenase-like predicted oxidoreductase
MGVMGIRIFAAGHLATTERHGREIPITANAEDAAEEARAAAVLAALAPEAGTPAQKALRFGLACPLLSTIVVGIGETWHLEEALAAEGMGPLAPASMNALQALWKRPSLSGIAERSRPRRTSGKQPGNSSVAGDVQLLRTCFAPACAQPLS